MPMRTTMGSPCSPPSACVTASCSLHHLTTCNWKAERKTSAHADPRASVANNHVQDPLLDSPAEVCAPSGQWESLGMNPLRQILARQYAHGVCDEVRAFQSCTQRHIEMDHCCLRICLGNRLRCRASNGASKADVNGLQPHVHEDATMDSEIPRQRSVGRRGLPSIRNEQPLGVVTRRVAECKRGKHELTDHTKAMAASNKKWLEPKWFVGLEWVRYCAAFKERECLPKRWQQPNGRMLVGRF